jgi:hypothetical protein
MWWVLIGVALAVGVAGCRGRARPVYEYEPPVTITSTGAPPPAAAPTTTTHAPVWRRGEAR